MNDVCFCEMRKSVSGAFSLVSLLVLAACGGADPGAGSESKANGANSGPRVTSTPAVAGAPDGTLTAQSLARAESEAAGADASRPLDELSPGAFAPKQAYSLGHVARKALASRIPVYRFFNTLTAAHFYTTSETEKANVVATMPFMTYDGPAFSGASAFSPGLSPVHRFYNRVTGVHFYTISEAERAQVVATLPQYTYEGVAYHASQVAGQGFVPLYRFFVPKKGFHFYTASEAEKNSIQANLGATYSYEGVGYYVLDSNWAAEKLPHTGVTASQCYGSASVNTLESCADVSVLNFNSQQDGHRVAIRPMSYSLVGSNPKESCVKDNVTGLIWEGKTTSGPRSWIYTYTRLGLNVASDTVGYVNAVNADRLCGFNDWRLPTAFELQTIVDHGVFSGVPLNATWFPNTQPNGYWASDSYDAASGFYADFRSAGGYVSVSTVGSDLYVRLVRGNLLAGPRFSYHTVGYAGDAANNLVNDALTGLQWRRCVEGMSWNGTTCTGTALNLSQGEALARARDNPGWRLPNVKELGSLVDRTRSVPPRVDAVAFPGGATTLWSSTPKVSDASQAWYLQLYDGYDFPSARFNFGAARLVRTNP